MNRARVLKFVGAVILVVLIHNAARLALAPPRLEIGSGVVIRRFEGARPFGSSLGELQPDFVVSPRDEWLAYLRGVRTVPDSHYPVGVELCFENLRDGGVVVFTDDGMSGWQSADAAHVWSLESAYWIEDGDSGLLLVVRGNVAIDPRTGRRASIKIPRRNPIAERRAEYIRSRVPDGGLRLDVAWDESTFGAHVYFAKRKGPHDGMLDVLLRPFETGSLCRVGPDGSEKVVHVRTGLGGGWAIDNVFVSPDGRFVAFTAGEFPNDRHFAEFIFPFFLGAERRDHYLFVYDTESGHEYELGPSDYKARVQWSRDSRLLYHGYEEFPSPTDVIEVFAIDAPASAPDSARVHWDDARFHPKPSHLETRPKIPAGPPIDPLEALRDTSFEVGGVEGYYSQVYLRPAPDADGRGIRFTSHLPFSGEEGASGGLSIHVFETVIDGNELLRERRFVVCHIPGYPRNTVGAWLQDTGLQASEGDLVLYRPLGADRFLVVVADLPEASGGRSIFEGAQEIRRLGRHSAQQLVYRVVASLSRPGYY